MAGPHKRTRSETAHHDENPTTTTTTPRTTRRQAQAQAQAQALTITPPSPNPSIGGTPNSEVRVVQTRPNAQQAQTPTRSNTTPLHRTTSLFTRRTNNSSHNATPFTPFAFGGTTNYGLQSPSIGSPALSGGGQGQGQGQGQGAVGMLTRTQSVPSLMASPSHMKAMSGSGGGGVGDKGEGPSDYFGLGGRKFGRGKENIPPSENGDAGGSSSSRKRLRVGRSNRGRSGSVSSLRSETPSSRSPSLHRTVQNSGRSC